MASKLSPEYLIAKYIKSATNGRSISVRLRRILTLVLIPLWIAGLVWSGYMSYEGFKAIRKKNNIEEWLRYARLQYANNNPSMNISENPSILDSEMQLRTQKDRIDLVYYFPAFLVIGFIIPWIVLRLTFWIIDADKGKEQA